jgi:hypothetical protein
MVNQLKAADPAPARAPSAPAPCKPASKRKGETKRWIWMETPQRIRTYSLALAAKARRPLGLYIPLHPALMELRVLELKPPDAPVGGAVGPIAERRADLRPVPRDVVSRTSRKAMKAARRTWRPTLARWVQLAR